MDATSWKHEWDFARRYNFNHGSLGASPVKLLQAKTALDAEINRDREQFAREGGWGRSEQARLALAAFLNAGADNLVLTTNITDSLNSVLKSLRWEAGDELLVTNHIYVNYPGLLQELSARFGFVVVQADIPYVLHDSAPIVEAVMAAVSPRTRLALIDHITSGTACIFPVQEIVARLQARGVDCFVDGAHAPGQVPVDLTAMGAAYYGGNNHKWLCAPLSSGFLYVRPDRQGPMIPAVGSGFARSDASFVERFSWVGVIDVSPRIMIADTLRIMADMNPEGWDGIMARNHQMALRVRCKLAQALSVPLPVPDDMIGAMFTLPLGRLKFNESEMAKTPLQRGYDWMVAHYGFGVVFSAFGDEFLVRVTCHLYNEDADYDVLATALSAFMKEHEDVG